MFVMNVGLNIYIINIFFIKNFLVCSLSEIDENMYDFQM